MIEVAIFLLGAVALVFVVLSLWYLYQTVRVIWQYSSLLAIAAIIFSPLVHIVFYFIPKDGFDSYERKVFKRYFMSIAGIFIVGVLAGIVIPLLEDDSKNVMAVDIDTILPWEWNIRTEDQEVASTTIEADADDKVAKQHFDAIYQAHPDANRMMESPEFEAWLQGQTVGKQDDIVRILREGTATEVIYVFNNFKQDLENYRADEY